MIHTPPETRNKPDSDFSPESGRRADEQVIIKYIKRKLARLDVDGDAGGEESVEPSAGTEWGPLSADVSNAVDVVGEHDEPGEDRQWNYNDSVHRSWVRQRLADNSDETPTDQEAILPGFGPEGLGSNARDTCGQPFPLLCDTCGNPVEIGSTCNMSVCSRCWKAWVRERGFRKAATLRRLRIEKNQATPGDELTKFHHMIISAPLSWYNRLARAGYDMPEALDETKTVVKKILDELRAQGVVVRHSYRQATREGELDSVDDMDTWKPVLTGDKPFYGEDSVRDDLAWQPHFHCVVASDWIKGGEFTKRVEEATGWVIHRITPEDSSVALETDGDMARAVTYSISHGDILVGEHRNLSTLWEVGRFEDTNFASGFKAQPHDLQWAEAKVEEVCGRLIGLASTSTECGRSIPAVDDPDELASKVLRELFPDDEEARHNIRSDTVLKHIANGTIGVETGVLTGGGGNISVDVGGVLGTGPSELPAKAVERLRSSASMTPAGDGGSCGPGCDDDHEHDVELDDGDDREVRDALDLHASEEGDVDDDGECGGKLIPLTEARARGLLDDDEWLASAPFADEAREVDREYDDDLPAYPESPGELVGVDEAAG